MPNTLQCDQLHLNDMFRLCLGVPPAPTRSDRASHIAVCWHANGATEPVASSQCAPVRRLSFRVTDTDTVVTHFRKQSVTPDTDPRW